VSSDEESEAETKEKDESEVGGFVTDERKEPVPRWEVLAENKADVWEQFASNPLRLEVGSLG
jgi:hypothetical protein